MRRTLLSSALIIATVIPASANCYKPVRFDRNGNPVGMQHTQSNRECEFYSRYPGYGYNTGAVPPIEDRSRNSGYYYDGGYYAQPGTVYVVPQGNVAGAIAAGVIIGIAAGAIAAQGR